MALLRSLKRRLRKMQRDFQRIGRFINELFSNPRLRIYRLGWRPYFPLWLRELTGKLMPPYSGYSNKRAVYVVTYGRSGSTLLTGYLTSLPGLVIRGENNMFPLSGFQAEQRILMSLERNFTNRLEPTSPWYGAHHFNVRRWRKDFMKALLNQMYPARPIPKTIGFKEIRWYYMTKPEEFADTIDWLLSLREPGAAIFLFRNLDKVQASEWWADQTEEQRREDRVKLEKWEMGCRAYATAHPDRAVVVTYEDFTTTPAAPKSICDLLGVKFSEETWRSVLSTDYSYKSGNQ